MEAGSFRCRANAAPRPRSAAIHSLSNMAAILSDGYFQSISSGQFCKFPHGYPLSGMQTVFETRRIRLRQLIAQYKTIAALNVKLGWEETNARLSQIQNRSIRSDRGTPYEMGDTTAREIEEALRLPTGWMDTPPGLEFAGDGEHLQALQRLVSNLAPYQVAQLVEIGTTLARLPERNTQVVAEDVSIQKDQVDTAKPDTGKATKLTAVKSVTPKAIGKGHFGPPAKGKQGGGSVSSGKNRRGARKTDDRGS